MIEMSDYDLYPDGDCEPDPPVTKTIWQSIRATTIALALGVGAISLLSIHYIASEIGFLIWGAAVLGLGFAAAYFLDKYLMVGYPFWARFAVGVITLLSVGSFIGIALRAHH